MHERLNQTYEKTPNNVKSDSLTYPRLSSWGHTTHLWSGGHCHGLHLLFREKCIKIRVMDMQAWQGSHLGGISSPTIHLMFFRSLARIRLSAWLSLSSVRKLTGDSGNKCLHCKHQKPGEMSLNPAIHEKYCIQPKASLKMAIGNWRHKINRKPGVKRRQTPDTRLR